MTHAEQFVTKLLVEPRLFGSVKILASQIDQHSTFTKGNSCINFSDGSYAEISKRQRKATAFTGGAA